MDLANYPRPTGESRRGIHWSPSVFHPTGSTLNWWMDELRAMHIKWVKLLDDGSGSSKHVCQTLLQNGIIPIVRLYRARPNPGSLDDAAIDTIADLVAVGVRYFESNNEPNQPIEWQEGEWQSGGRPELVMQHWLQDAEAIIAKGGYPAFPALAQNSRHPEHGSIAWYINAFQWLDDHAHDAAVRAFENGGWIAVHDAVLNHCYRDDEGEWHFDYPYDPVCQAAHPGRTIMEDDNSLIGHRVPAKLLMDHFGLQVPVISTEGGVFVPKGGWQQWDPLYPGYNYEGHAERTVAMFEWLRVNGEDYYFAMCPWLIASEKMGHVDPIWAESAWYRMDRDLPVVDAVKAMGPEPEPPLPALPLDETLRTAAWDKQGRPHNLDAAFPQYARRNNLGAPLTSEFDVAWAGKVYRVQGFTGAIIFAEVGDWDDIRQLPW